MKAEKYLKLRFEMIQNSIMPIKNCKIDITLDIIIILDMIIDFKNKILK